MNRPKRIACIVGAMVAVLLAVSVPAFAGGCSDCNNGGQVFSAPVYAPQILAAPVYHAPQVFAAPVYQRQVFAAPVYQQRQVFAAPVYAPQRSFVQKNVVVARAPRQPLFGFRSRSVQKNVVRGNAAAGFAY